MTLIAFFIGLISYYIFQRVRLGKFETIASKIVSQAEKEAADKSLKAELNLKEREGVEKKKLLSEEERLDLKEDKIEQRLAIVDKKLAEIEKKDHLLLLKKEQTDKALQLAEEMKLKVTLELEKISSLTSDEAKELLLNKMENEVKETSFRYTKKHYDETLRSSETEAKRLIALAIQRMASSTVQEVTTCSVSLPSEEMKGRIIGREGRNIRSLEKATGVSFIMDDTPQAVVISAYDPVRRHIAKIALTDLISDGRIHPTSIEEAVLKAHTTTNQQIYHFGEDAALRLGILNFQPEIITLLGKLKFRFSLGQNVLDHSIEVAHLMGIMASELGLDPALARRIGLLHDIGKAVSHEVQGTHALIGQDLALKYGESPNVANGIGCHHFEIDPLTIEGSLCSAADTLSASRSGARIEAVEEYVRRLKVLESLALSFPGVEKAYALQAGRELRVIAVPELLSDEDLFLLAKNLTKRIEKELDYPGKIKVTLMREKRVVDYAM